MLGLRLVVGSVVLSLRPGGGDALTRGLNEVRRKINGGALKIHTDNSEVVKLNSERKQSTYSFFSLTLRSSLEYPVAKHWKIAFHLQANQTLLVIIVLNEPLLAFLKATLVKSMLK